MFLKNLFIQFIFVWFVIANLQSQGNIKFGKVSMEELKMQQYKNDTSASAVILSDIGYTSFGFANEKGFFTDFSRHVRIKIFKKEGYNWATFAKSLYQPSNSADKERISTIKGFTYNLEGNKIVKTKLEKKAIFIEDVNENWERCSFTMPQVREGSVIEFKYNISSDYLLNFPEWQFQYSIPVQYSQYTANIPEYFIYHPISYGYESIDYKQENQSGSFTQTYYREVYEGTAVIKKRFTETVEYLSNVHIYTAENMPAFKNEPYISSVKNYINRLEFELASTQYPQSTRKDYTKSWESISKKLMDHEKFGHQIDKSGFFKEDLKSLDLSNKSDEEKILIIHNFIINKMKWNGRGTLYIDETLRKAYNEGTGNSADINFIFLNMLKEVGIKAYPVILSTRSNGRIHPVFPSLTRFNYMIVYTKIGDKQYLLDATNKNSPYYLIPKKCLNDKGRLISYGYIDWIDLTTDQFFSKVSVSDLTLDESGIFNGSLSYKREKYAALDFRDNVKDEKNTDDYIKNFEQDVPGLKVKNYTFKNIDSIYAPVMDDYEIEFDGYAEVMGDKIYFNPLLNDARKSNIFKLEERKYPVDYAYPFNETIIKKIKIPENYIVEEVPKNAAFALPEQNGKFIYNISSNEGELMINVQFQINKSLFLPDEYQSLKIFYDEMVKKQSEQIVLKKKI